MRRCFRPQSGMFDPRNLHTIDYSSIIYGALTMRNDKESISRSDLYRLAERNHVDSIEELYSSGGSVIENHGKTWRHTLHIRYFLIWEYCGRTESGTSVALAIRIDPCPSHIRFFRLVSEAERTEILQVPGISLSWTVHIISFGSFQSRDFINLCTFYLECITAQGLFFYLEPLSHAEILSSGFSQNWDFGVSMWYIVGGDNGCSLHSR